MKFPGVCARLCVWSGYFDAICNPHTWCKCPSPFLFLCHPSLDEGHYTWNHTIIDCSLSTHLISHKWHTICVMQFWLTFQIAGHNARRPLRDNGLLQQNECRKCLGYVSRYVYIPMDGNMLNGCNQPPALSSRRAIAALSATNGVYSRQNHRSLWTVFTLLNRLS